MKEGEKLNYENFLIAYAAAIITSLETNCNSENKKCHPKKKKGTTTNWPGYLYRERERKRPWFCT